MKTQVSAVFEQRSQAELAAEALVRAGFSADDVVLASASEGVVVTVVPGNRCGQAEQLLASYEPVLRRTFVDDAGPAQPRPLRGLVPEGDLAEDAYGLAEPAVSAPGSASPTSEADWLEQALPAEPELGLPLARERSAEIPEADFAEQYLPAFTLSPETDE